MTPSQWIVDVTPDSFDQEVVNRSRELPVVVDFWAPWCGPCRQLSPLLEKLAREKAGGFVLAKINTDEAPELAQAFQVNGIPAVFAVRDGQVVNHFEGLLPEAELRRFLNSLGPTEESELAGHALELEGRDPKAAIAAYRQLFADNPHDPAARVGLARVLIATGNDSEAATLLEPVTDGEQASEAERLRAVLSLRTVPHGDADWSNAQAAGGVAPAAVLAARGEYVPAMDALLKVAEDDKSLATGPVRELMVRIFTALGATTPLATEYRNRLRNMLY